MTMLLRTGTNGSVIQISYDSNSEFGTHFKMYHLNHGAVASDAYATGSYDPFSGAVLNGRNIGQSAYNGGSIEEWDLYRYADSNIDRILSANTGPSGMLILGGSGVNSWVPGSQLRQALLAYANL